MVNLVSGARRFLRSSILALSALGLSGVGIAAQDDLGSAFRDPAAERLLTSARGYWELVDHSIVSYTAVVRKRFGAKLRMPLKDRTLYRAETASRVWWSREGPVVIKALAAREETPVGLTPADESTGLMDEVYDPAGDRIYFGLNLNDDDDDDGDDDFWVEHPFAPGSEAHYEFAAGDTLTLTFPDGRRFVAAELQVIPREASPHLLSGSFWIETETGALVRAVYRLATILDLETELEVTNDEGEDVRIPGLLRPITFSLDLVTVEYGLWDFKYWLPRNMRMEGVARAGIFKAPGAIEMSYSIENVVGEDELEEEDVAEWSRLQGEAKIAEWVDDGQLRSDDPEGSWNSRRRRARRGSDKDGRRTILLLPQDPEEFHRSELLPPPVWKDADGFSSQEDLESFAERLLAIPEPAAAEPKAQFLWGMGREDLTRFNRVEGLSVGASVQRPLSTPVGPARVEVIGRLGVADFDPRGQLTLHWNGIRRNVGLSVYHDLTPVDADARSLGFGSSLASAVLGRDDGEYYETTGVRFDLRPTDSKRPWWGLSLYGEQQRSVERETNVSVPNIFDGDHIFRPNILADRADQLGGELRLQPWWGTESNRFQVGASLNLQAEVGDFEFRRAELALRTAVQIVPSVRTGIEVEGGTAWGNVPTQSLWYLGGAHTIRGYGGNVARGPDYLRYRAEVARPLSRLPISIAVFSDGGWAGEWRTLDGDDALISLGAGASVLDGLIRIDIARGIRAPKGWRLELYLDAIL